MSGDESCTLTAIRTSDAMRKELTVSLSKKFGELKDTLREEFDVPSDQNTRIFYMGRELKSGGRSLGKLGLGKFANSVLHVHSIPSPSNNSSTQASGTKRRRAKEQPEPAVAAKTNEEDGVIELVDDSDDEVHVSKRR
mmetsp:Transcript_123378/g.356627  ORF Transcript_123378/g.356627 Transcript_123378/m.356627 type:complete len:138 (-) Transcript_123378:193-606(-)|eukprot:CAMPEP_0176018242 /NCGR_PEP_ID=MMETSP0120_2-20121206/8777_1 /TAXON_ID=160619 /ORGANISM="Kryptoperidinium foliaceum, Strain CCMP 1326" /LENGTH=137 /DNA_ID=CAMNT_0017351287 /DNA_START=171 /DNA_END=584 /DNA_ORIENTATION=-